MALGNVHAGLFSNDDALSEKLLASGLSTGERLFWGGGAPAPGGGPLGNPGGTVIRQDESIPRMPTMKNVGGRHAGSGSTAAQFLKRFRQGDAVGAAISTLPAPACHRRRARSTSHGPRASAYCACSTAWSPNHFEEVAQT